MNNEIDLVSRDSQDVKDENEATKMKPRRRSHKDEATKMKPRRISQRIDFQDDKFLIFF